MLRSCIGTVNGGNEGGTTGTAASVFLDGTSLRTPHRKEIAAQYPPTSNQHGPSHWPVIRMLVAHDLYTGLALHPEWGPMNGEQAVSEQGLLESAFQHQQQTATDHIA
jgi:hypothetical protein